MSDPMTGIAALVGAGNSIFNTGMQMENQRYQRDLQRTMFAREDNSIQRRVLDLKAAHLNPVLAAGQGAQSGPVVGSQAPQTTASADLAQVLAAMKMKADISKTNADTKLTEVQARKAEQDVSFAGEANPLRIAEMRYGLQYSSETIANRIAMVSNGVSLQELEKRNRDLDAQIKDVKVPREKVELAIRIVDEAANAVYQPQKAALDLEAKKLAIEMQKKENAEKTHNLDWYGSKDLPTNTHVNMRFPNVSKALRQGSLGKFMSDIWGLTD